ncbi:MAG: hypothetical protein AB7I27_15605 [Bacteriovoracaceae bacterium]
MEKEPLSKKEEKSSKKYQVNTTPVRVTKATAKAIKTMIQKMNKKTYGKKIRPDDLIQKSISLLTDEHLEEIKQSTMTNSDRLELAYQDHCKAHGQISKDEYFGLLLQSKSA